MLFKNTACKKNNLYAKKILLQKNLPQYVNRGIRMKKIHSNMHTDKS